MAKIKLQNYCKIGRGGYFLLLILCFLFVYPNSVHGQWVSGTFVTYLPIGKVGIGTATPAEKLTVEAGNISLNVMNGAGRSAQFI